MSCFDECGPEGMLDNCDLMDMQRQAVICYTRWLDIVHAICRKIIHKSAQWCLGLDSMSFCSAVPLCGTLFLMFLAASSV